MSLSVISDRMKIERLLSQNNFIWLIKFASFLSLPLNLLMRLITRNAKAVEWIIMSEPTQLSTSECASSYRDDIEFV